MYLVFGGRNLGFGISEESRSSVSHRVTWRNKQAKSSWQIIPQTLLRRFLGNVKIATQQQTSLYVLPPHSPGPSFFFFFLLFICVGHWVGRLFWCCYLSSSLIFCSSRTSLHIHSSEKAGGEIKCMGLFCSAVAQWNTSSLCDLTSKDE